MERTVSKWEALEHYNFFESIKTDVGNKFFSLFRFNGNLAFKKQAEIARQMLDSSRNDGFVKFEKEKNDLVLTFSEKDEDGKPKIVDGMVNIPSDVINGYYTALKELEDAYKEDIVKHDADFNETVEAIKADTFKVDFPKIKFEHIPENLSSEKCEYIFVNFLDKDEAEEN